MKWIAWFNRDADGVITDAGVDSEDRAVNICVTTCENVVVEDKETFNAVVTRDTLLLAAAPELLAACESVIANYDDANHEKYDEEKWSEFRGVDALRAAIAKARVNDRCDDCNSECDEFMICPDGAEICHDCFNAGAH